MLRPDHFLETSKWLKCQVAGSKVAQFTTHPENGGGSLLIYNENVGRYALGAGKIWPKVVTANHPLYALDHQASHWARSKACMDAFGACCSRTIVGPNSRPAMEFRCAVQSSAASGLGAAQLPPVPHVGDKEQHVNPSLRRPDYLDRRQARQEV